MKHSIKIALIVLYAMQLTLMFRETVVHAYRSAVDHGETERDRIVRAVAGLQHFISKAVKPTFDPHEKLQARRPDSLAFLLFGFGVVSDDGGDIEEDHRNDQKEALRKKGQRRTLREYLLANFFIAQLRIAAPPNSERAFIDDLLRTLTFVAS
jgi:hypothetical protein